MFSQKEAQDIAIEEKFKREMEKLKKIESKITDGMNVLQNPIGYTRDAVSMVQRMKESAECVASGILSEEDCDFALKVNVQLREGLDRLVASTTLA